MSKDSFRRKKNYQRRKKTSCTLELNTYNNALVKKFLCTKCGKTFSRIDSRVRHEKGCKKAGLCFTCNTCGRKFGRKDNLIRHLNKICQPDNNSRCRKSEDSFSRKENCQKLEKTCTVELNTDDVKKLLCAKCGKTFSQMDIRVRHEKECKAGLWFTCNTCGITFRKKNNLARHVKSCQPDNISLSRKSGDDFSRKENCQTHRKTSTLELDTDNALVKKLLCTKCGQIFSRIYSRVRHEVVCKTAGLCFTCNTCGGKFRRKDNLIRHLNKTCQPDNNSLCRKSGDSFSRKENCQSLKKTSCALELKTDNALVQKLLCTKCGKTFSRVDHRVRHEKICNIGLYYTCNTCGAKFKRKEYLPPHFKTCQPDNNSLFRKSGDSFSRKENRQSLKKTCTVELNSDNTSRMDCSLRDEQVYLSVSNGPCNLSNCGYTNKHVDAGDHTCNKVTCEDHLLSYIVSNYKHYDLPEFLQSVAQEIMVQISLSLDVHSAIKINMKVECIFTKSIGETSKSCQHSFKTKNKTVFTKTLLVDFLVAMFKDLTKDMDGFVSMNTGWTLKAIDRLCLQVSKYNPLAGSSYEPLPDNISHKGACINVQNMDELCFMYSVLTKFVKIKPHRQSAYKNVLNKYNFDCLSYPVQLKDVIKFEKINSISINIFGLDKDKNVYPIKVVKEELKDHRDLLLLNNPGGSFHYVYIKNFEKLIRSQVTKRQEKIVICKQCLSHFRGENKAGKLNKHKKLCNDIQLVLMDIRTKNPYIRFLS